MGPKIQPPGVKTPLSNDLISPSEDCTSFAQVFDEYFKRVFTYIRYRCNDDALADDLTAHTFERVMVHLHEYNPARGPLAPWVFGIARNAVNDHYRKQRRFPWLPLDLFQQDAAPDPDPETHLIAQETETELLAAFARLSRRERDLLGLKFAGHLTNREIARLSGLKESNVGVQVFRAVQKLRKMMEEVDK